jgi:hypothetical protein
MKPARTLKEPPSANAATIGEEGTNTGDVWIGDAIG